MKPGFGYIYISFSLSLVILVALAYFYYSRYNSFQQYSLDVEQNYKIVEHLKSTQQTMRDLESSVRGYIITKDSSFLQSYQDKLQLIAPGIDSLKILLDGNIIQRERVLRAERTLARNINLLQRNIEITNRYDTAQLIFMVKEGRYLMQELVREIEQIRSTELEEGRKYLENKQRYEQLTPEFFKSILIVSIIITLVSFIVIIRQNRTRLRYQHELELRLTELNRSTAELEQFTYVASHDLQEPLRKIRTFSDRLVFKHRENLDAETRNVLDRINVSAQRMQELIADMVNFTNLVNRDENPSRVDLNYILSRVMQEYNQHEQLKIPVVATDTLPVIQGYPGQLYLCFKSIVDNAVKFSKEGIQPSIVVSYLRVEEKSDTGSSINGNSFYHRITFVDNGIGFENEFAEKIFMIFQRLHNQHSAYKGKGIGLAIAQRVVINHNGYISASGNPGEGATFNLYFPAVA